MRGDEAGSDIDGMEQFRSSPSYFHIGIHNLPPARADALIGEVKLFSRNPSAGLRNDLLAAITGQPETLVVLNHPLWDQGTAGAEAHATALRGLLESSGGFIHALELNGLRPWEENQQVIRLANALDRTLVQAETVTAASRRQWST